MTRTSTGTENTKKKSEKGWRISALIRDKDMQYQIKYRALDDEISYEDLVIAGIKLYLQTPSKNPDRYAFVTRRARSALTDPVDEDVKAAGHASKSR